MLFYLLPLILPALAIPTPTPSATGSSSDPSRMTTAPAASITAAPELVCSSGSTLVHTTDCTMGTPISYCSSPEPPIQCATGSYPGVWHPGHCMELQTCYALDAAWITTECSNGGIPWSTSTLYEGTLADGVSTVVTAVSCSCARDQWYSLGSNANMFCMPSTSCPPGMTTSVSTNSYCATAPVSDCQGVATTTKHCQCADATSTPVYEDRVGGVATGCK